MKHKSSPAKASHTRLPKGHPAFNLPAPQGGDFQGAQLNAPSPMGPGAAPMTSQGPSPDGGSPGGF